MRKEQLFIILASVAALVIGLQIGFASLPAPKPKRVEESVTKPDDFQGGLRDAKTELKMVQRFALTSTIEHDRLCRTWIYTSQTPSRIAVDWYYVASYPEKQVQMTRNDVSRILTYDRYLVVIRPIYGVIEDSELEQFSLRFSSYFMTMQQQKEDGDVR
ncbi:hypothetical protein BLD48_12295 [Exiguobacterium sp. KRL4]|uniref:hypothetical protein n=1 Tax=Exiguobacterium sp. KRL4 TaxID=1914536 RepID=UPI0008F84479|nr:hypothetical protein [Exiguobacterium sp. KRL4]OIN66122.1 hypothetical protein BLD48_12295 [Exiguobacterium sp. KRL4]